MRLKRTYRIGKWLCVTVTITYFMTTEVTMLPPATITTAANRIVNEVKHINRVLFDYTTKPPATIEFE